MRDFFYFPKCDRRAVVALGSIVVFCIGVLVIADAVRGGGMIVSAADERSDSVRQDVCAETDGLSGNVCQPLRSFDPNTVDSLSLVQLGIHPWKVRNFLRYRAAGKVFRSAEDMGDTYGWTAMDVEIVAPYVSVAAPCGKAGNAPSRAGTARDGMGEKALPRHAASSAKGEPAYTSAKFRTLTPVDVNTADLATLCRIPGVGEGIGGAILRYRSRLGGFYSTRQLLEIGIVSAELLEWFTVADTASLSKLPINTASFHAVNSHPYITYDQARSLMRYIRLYGGIKDEPSLLSTGIFEAEDMERLRPYIEY